MIERAVPGPFVELFARSRREGGDVIADFNRQRADILLALAEVR